MSNTDAADAPTPDATESITIYSDYVCPFCYLGRQSFARYQETREEPLAIDWHPFDLRAGGARSGRRDRRHRGRRERRGVLRAGPRERPPLTGEVRRRDGTGAEPTSTRSRRRSSRCTCERPRPSRGSHSTRRYSRRCGRTVATSATARCSPTSPPTLTGSTPRSSTRRSRTTTSATASPTCSPRRGARSHRCPDVRVRRPRCPGRGAAGAARTARRRRVTSSRRLTL